MTHLRAIWCSLCDTVDECRAIALSEDAFWIESQVPRYRHLCLTHVHLRVDSEGVRVLIIATCELIGTDRIEVRQDIFRFDISIADPHFCHGDLSGIRSDPLVEIALFDFKGSHVASFSRQ